MRSANRSGTCAGEGPQLDAITDRAALARLKTEVDQGMLAPVYETIGRVRQSLAAAVALLGFCGAPWTVASYMIAGQGTPDQAPARLFAYEDPEGFAALIDILVDASAGYLIRQLQAGVDAVQIFDTWAGVLPAEEFRRWCIEPTQRIIAKVRAVIPEAKIIGFPRGVGAGLLRYVEHVPVDAVGLDWMVDPSFARDQIQWRMPVQGNLDPLVLVAGGAALDRAVDAVLEVFARGLSSSISDTAFCRRRRLPMWSACSRGCAARGADRWRRPRSDGYGRRSRLRSRWCWPVRWCGGSRPGSIRGSRRCTSSRSSPGWRECSICRGCSSITARPSRAPSSPKPSR